MRRSTAVLSLLTGSLLVLAARADGPCVSGLQPGQRPGPYASLVATGENRGQSHCFICETADRPAVIVFAKRMSDPLAKLLQGLDKAVTRHKAAELRAWGTFLSADQVTLDPLLVKWAKKNGIGNVPLGVFEDPKGPPAYRLSDDADVTVLLYVKQKVVHNFAFRPGELDDKKAAEILKAIPDIVQMKK